MPEGILGKEGTLRIKFVYGLSVAQMSKNQKFHFMIVLSFDVAFVHFDKSNKAFASYNALLGQHRQSMMQRPIYSRRAHMPLHVRLYSTGVCNIYQI